MPALASSIITVNQKSDACSLMGSIEARWRNSYVLASEAKAFTYVSWNGGVLLTGYGAISLSNGFQECDK